MYKFRDNSSVILKSLHDLKNLEDFSFGSELINWTKFHTVNFKNNVEPWHVSLTLICILIATGTILWFRLKGKPSNSTIIHFNALRNREQQYNHNF